MALTRRELLAALTSGMAVASCSRMAADTQTKTPYQELFEVAARGRDKVLVCMPETSQTEQAWTGLSDELGQEFGLVAVRVEGRSDTAVIAEAVKHHRPRSIVLMNNPTLSAYRHLEKDWPTAKGIPTVSIMTSFLQARSLGPQATGVAYEVPLITSVTQVRRVLADPVDSVGVVFRRSLARFVAQQRDLAAREKIRLLGAQVSEEPNESEIKGALRALKHQVHAVWVLNDDRLLTPKLISRGWLPGLNERPWRPTIVGAESLVAAGLSFGTFAVLPDHTELGTQAANIVYDIADGDWSVPPDYPTQEPLSTKSTIDLVQVRERFQLQPDALARVDRVLE